MFRRSGMAVQVDPIKPTLKAPGTKRLKLKCADLLSSLAFKFNLRHFTLVPPPPPLALRGLLPPPSGAAIASHEGFTSQGVDAARGPVLAMRVEPPTFNGQTLPASEVGGPRAAGWRQGLPSAGT